MPFRCTDVRLIEAFTVDFSYHIAAYDPSDYGFFEGEPFQCELEGSPHRIHAACMREIPGSEREVWFCWVQDEDQQFVVIYDPCGSRPHPEADVCCLFQGHSGLCEWAFIDPEEVARRARVDQWLKHLETYGIFTVPTELMAPGKRV